MSGPYILAIDEGSSSARAILVAPDGETAGSASVSVTPTRPRPGWVELDPEALWQSVMWCVRRAMTQADARAADILAVGITTHRETCLIWDRRTGVPVHNAIMWMSTQTDDIIRRWSADGLDDLVRRRTGLRNDSFFSAGKLAWLLENVEGVRADAAAGHLAAGTIDSWLLWNLTGGRVHRTDASSASRTAMLDLATGQWDPELCARYGIPMALLPEITESGSIVGEIDPAVLPGAIPIGAILADQQAGLYGQGCLEEGQAKNTYGTAGVLVVNTGASPRIIDGTAASIAWNLGGKLTYETEGVVAHCGQALHWLRDNLAVPDADARSEQLALSVSRSSGLYFVPAFAGLWDPYADRDVRGAIFGLTLETEQAHLVRAAVESMAYQTRDVVDALAAGGTRLPVLRVDGGAARNDFLCQFQSDILGIPIERPFGLERTALGVAQLAGEAVGHWDAATGPSSTRQVERVFEPVMSDSEREDLVAGWRDAVAAARSLPARRAASSTPSASGGSAHIERNNYALENN